MGNQRNKPFYLKAYGNSGKGLIAAGVLLGVLSVANPFLLIPVALLIGMGINNIMKGKSELNILIDSAIAFYENKDYVECEFKANRILELDKDNIKANILLALVSYEQEEYEDVVRLLNLLPKEKIKNELDLELKLGNSYLQLGEYKKAEEVFENLIKFEPRSEYLQKVLKQCRGTNKE